MVKIHATGKTASIVIRDKPVDMHMYVIDEAISTDEIQALKEIDGKKVWGIESHMTPRQSVGWKIGVIFESEDVIEGVADGN